MFPLDCGISRKVKEFEIRQLRTKFRRK